MSQPKVIILFSNNNLLRNINVLDGIAGIVGTAQTVGLQGVPKVVFSLQDAITQGFTEAAEPFLYKHLADFYREVGGNQKLYVMGVANSVTMEDMLDTTNQVHAKQLVDFAEGEIRLLGVVRNPPVGYDGGTEFIDADVPAAVTMSKTFAEGCLAALKPLRVLIEGRIEDEASNTIYTPNAANNGYAGVVIGNNTSGKGAAVGLALGRAVKYGAHIKLGKVANGALTINTAFIGTKPLSQVLNLETLSNKGFIHLMKHPMKAGFFFGRDWMCSNDDFRFLTNGRCADKAAVLSAATYVEQIESEVVLDAETGKIRESDVTFLEQLIAQQIEARMGDQVSAVKVYINPDQNIVNTGKLNVRVRLVPLGYTTEIEVEIGLAASIG